MTTIQVRMDERTKRESAKILKKLGLDMSSAINVYLKRVIATNGIPFPLLTENGMTVEEEEEILEAEREARRGKNITKPMNIEEALKYLHTLPHPKKRTKRLR